MRYSDKMLAIARRAGGDLEEVTDDISSFQRGLIMPDGGFRGRGTCSDLYYTVFGLDCLLALDDPPDIPRLTDYLSSFGDGEGLDLIHLGCLARCRARLDDVGVTWNGKQQLAGRIEKYRTADGGFNGTAGAARGSIYGCFLACSAYDDLALPAPDKGRILASIDGLRTSEGTFVAEHGLDVATTNAVVGGMLLLMHLGESLDNDLVTWLLGQCHEQGGFLAAPVAPVGDLVSTATALFALQEAGACLDEIREPCTAFVASLWDERGGFSGHWLDDTVDPEYSFYGMLSLGCLT